MAQSVLPSVESRHVKRRLKLLQASKGMVHPGWCAICGPTMFVITGSWLREHYRCLRCLSIPRMRALVHVLERVRPEWRKAEIFESSPGSASSRYIAAHCSRYTPSQLFPDVRSGEYRGGVRREDLESLTYADESLDIIITQDVFEHVLDPARAFAEVARVLRPDGCHVWTVPIYERPHSVVRARWAAPGEIEYLQPPDYHGNPLGGGSLVAREWGDDILDFVDASRVTTTTRYRMRSWWLGIRGAMTDVLVTRRTP